MKLLISITTLPNRMKSDFFRKVIDSIINQKHIFELKILLYIPIQCNRFPDIQYDLDDLNGLENKLWIHRGIDYGPASKFLSIFNNLESIQKYNFTHVLICDDDIILRDNILFRMMQKIPYHSEYSIWTNSSLHKLQNIFIVEGYSGILIPMNWFIQYYEYDKKFIHYIMNELTIQNKCYNVDDILLSFFIYKSKISVYSTGFNPFYDWMDRTMTDTHPEWFELCKNTDRDKNNLNLNCLHYLENIYKDFH